MDPHIVYVSKEELAYLLKKGVLTDKEKKQISVIRNGVVTTLDKEEKK